MEGGKVFNDAMLITAENEMGEKLLQTNVVPSLQLKLLSWNTVDLIGFSVKSSLLIRPFL
jgi:hypothetical protein